MIPDIIQFMSIGFDLDRIVVDYPPFLPDIIIKSLDRKKQITPLTYRMPSKPEQILRKMSHYSFLRPAIEKNLLFIKSLTSINDNKRYLISGRFGFLEKATLSLAKKHRFDTIFDDMYFNFNNEQPHIFKDKIIREISLDKYIDDDLDLLTYLADRNSQTTFYWYNNHQEQELRQNLFAITDLKRILLS